jgi:hypothetical protein
MTNRIRIIIAVAVLGFVAYVADSDILETIQ